MTAFFSSNFLVIAHRGASAEAPENTLPAFARALAVGAPAVELDVYAAHGELWVIHDDALDRTTNGTGRLEDHDPATLRGFDAGAGAVIPTLTEVLDLIGARAGVNIELKGPGTAEPVCALLEKRNTPPEQIVLSAFDHRELERAKALAPQWPRGALFGKDPSNAVTKGQALGAASLNFADRTVTQALLSEAQSAGFRTLVYTVNDRTRARELRDWGASGIFCDDPGAMIAAVTC
ncbi:MAG: glycerophosphodiester phosphodiesterase [Gammaproteobacteria bacterium]|jgi:glycerophosphoryl diester phosphodiesterase|nr:glycerophosphodiester phosphodiesterase [Gammaproteobacteria bacterium]